MDLFKIKNIFVVVVISEDESESFDADLNGEIFSF